jgi:hypothetical protein
MFNSLYLRGLNMIDKKNHTRCKKYKTDIYLNDMINTNLEQFQNINYMQSRNKSNCYFYIFLDQSNLNSHF